MSRVNTEHDTVDVVVTIDGPAPREALSPELADEPEMVQKQWRPVQDACSSRLDTPWRGVAGT